MATSKLRVTGIWAPCSMCGIDIQARTHTYFFPNMCLLKAKNTDDITRKNKVHVICENCWFKEGGFRDATDHRCPGCVKDIVFSTIKIKQIDYGTIEID